MEVSPPEQRRPLVVCGIHELPPQRNSSQISAHNPGDMFYQVPAPTPSSSAAAWMGCAWQVDSAPVPSQIDPAVGDRGDSYATLMDSCMCGCGGGACIPQREYDRPRTDPLSQHELAETILFRVNGKCGYPLGDALRKRYRGLDGRDDKMFADSKTSISLRIEWLPYGKWTRQIRTVTWQKMPELIDRAKLATEVAKRMRFFLREMEGRLPDPSYLEYRVKPGIIDIDNLELVALKRVSKSSWMPHFRLIAPPQAA